MFQSIFQIKTYTLLLLFTFITAFIVVEDARANIPQTQRPYTINNKTYYPIFPTPRFQQQGKASWYGPKFHGRPTSNGEVFDMYGMTAAHKELPMNTLLRVKNLENGKEITVRINDRGPFITGRIIDLSYAAAKALNMVRSGIVQTEISVISEAPYNRLRKHYNQEYYVQVGAFSKPQNAQRIQQNFQNAGHKAVIRPYNSSKSKASLYLVQIYVGEDFQHAQKAEYSLLQSGYNDAFLIAYHQKG